MSAWRFQAGLDRVASHVQHPPRRCASILVGDHRRPDPGHGEPGPPASTRRAEAVGAVPTLVDTDRPTIPHDIRKLIREMSAANVTWGAPRVHDELLKLGIDVSQATVAKYMVRRNTPPYEGVRTPRRRLRMLSREPTSRLLGTRRPCISCSRAWTSASSHSGSVTRARRPRIVTLKQTSR